MKKHTLIFIVSYLLLTFAIDMGFELLNLGSSSPWIILPILGAVLISAFYFAKTEKRHPTPTENKSFALQSMVWIWLVSLLLFAIAFMLSPANIQSITQFFSDKKIVLMITGVSIVFSFIYYWIIRVVFSWFTKIIVGKTASI